MGEEAGATVTRLGLITDPDFPQQVVENLADTLADRLSGDGNGDSWSVEVEVDPLTAGKRSTQEMLKAGRDRLEYHDWDYAICVTDLPVRVGHHPVLADANLDEAVAVMSLPAVGGSRRRTQQVVLELLSELTERTEDSLSDDAEAGRRGLRGWLTELVAPIRRETTDHEGEVDVHYTTPRVRGMLRLLTGMVRTNRPWRLVFGLPSALAGAVAVSAFGLTSSTIWQVSDRLDPSRRVVGTVVFVAVLVFWLIAVHGLWEHSTGRPTTRRTGSSPRVRDREQVVLYNASTVLSLTVGVSCMYALLLAINLAMASFFISTDLLSEMLGHPAGGTTYFSLAWGFTTMGMFGGALGSSLESDQAVRQAAYGYREEQRRASEQKLDARSQ